MATVILGTRGTSGWPEYAGSTWVRLQYVLGLRKLGVDAYWVDRLPAIDDLAHHHSLDYLMARFARTMADFGLADRYCVVYDGGRRYFGMDEARLRGVIRRADLLLNVSGHLPPDCPLMSVGLRAYVDVDPGFTQIWAGHCNMGFDRHHLFFTVGQNVGTSDFRIPTNGVRWARILPPVYLDEWPSRSDPRCTRFSTVADWRAMQHAIHEDEYYGGKRKEFLRFLCLPKDSKQSVEVALCISMSECEDIELLVGKGWKLDDPYQYAGDPYSYREFIQFSRAEFSVAKHGYVKSNSGWVSDRTACYLASGKPALVQSTGFEARLPTGRGLLTFRTLEEAVAGVREINGHYAEHCRAARELAEEQFHSSVVLRQILATAGVPVGAKAAEQRHGGGAGPVKIQDRGGRNGGAKAGRLVSGRRHLTVRSRS
jgi:hypothetical protein